MLRRRHQVGHHHEVMGKADELARAGRHREAIDLLTEANREHRDRAVEHQLVRLRREGAESDGSGPGVEPAPWPEHIDDLWPGTRIPEVTRDELTVEALRSAIHHHGSLLVRGLAAPAHVDRLVTAVDAALAAFDASDLATGGAVGRRGARRRGRNEGIDGWYQPFAHQLIADADRIRKRSRGSILAVESPPALFDLIEVADELGLRELVERYFGEPPYLLARKVTLRLVARDELGGWHQDGAFMGQSIRSLNVWLALSHCGDTAPGLDVVGRRIPEVVPADEGAYAPWGMSADAALRVAGDDIVRPVFEAGDALLFDHLCLHKTATTPAMVDDRYALETWFMAPSTYATANDAADGAYIPRDQVPLLF